jgi:hypothetical protein
MLDAATRIPTDAEGRDCIEREAFNAAFRELGLHWHWDDETYAALKENADDEQRIRTYLESHHPHLLKAYDAAFLIDAVRVAKERHAAILAARGAASIARWKDCPVFALQQAGF